MARSSIEPELERLYGDLDHVIPRLASEQGQDGAARTLSTEKVIVRQSWVSRWLRDNGYVQRVNYVKKGETNV